MRLDGSNNGMSNESTPEPMVIRPSISFDSMSLFVSLRLMVIWSLSNFASNAE